MIEHTGMYSAMSNGPNGDLATAASDTGPLRGKVSTKEAHIAYIDLGNPISIYMCFVDCILLIKVTIEDEERRTAIYRSITPDSSIEEKLRKKSKGIDLDVSFTSLPFRPLTVMAVSFSASIISAFFSFSRCFPIEARTFGPLSDSKHVISRSFKMGSEYDGQGQSAARIEGEREGAQGQDG